MIKQGHIHSKGQTFQYPCYKKNKADYFQSVLESHAEVITIPTSSVSIEFKES